MTEIVDIEVRERVVSATDTSMALNAGAGAGKTTVLVDRVLGLLAAGTPPERIAVITFTEKAAGEVAERVRDALESALARSEGDVRSNLQAAVERLSDLQTSTIHAFASSLLKMEAYESRWAPRTELIGETLGASAADDAYRTWRKGYDERHPADIAALRGACAEQTLRAGALELVRFADLEPVVGPEAIDWTEARATLAAIHTTFESLRAECNKPDTCKLLANNADGLMQIAAALEGDDERLVSEAVKAKFKKVGGKAADWNGDACAGFKSNIDEVKAWIERWSANLFAPLHRRVVLDLYDHFLPLVATQKRARSQADYDDLLFECRRLLVERSAARARLAERFDAILVDEVQDTDPVQAEIALLLTREPELEGAWHEHPPRPGRLFAVGDAKQSIYRFRRADVATWHALGDAIAKDGERLMLTQNFRSVPGIVAFSNFVFSGLEDFEAITPYRDAAELDPVVVLRAEEETETQAAVHHVSELLRSGAQVFDRAIDGLRPLRPGDVMIVLPAWSRADKVLTDFATAGIPAVVEGGATLFSRDEVRLALAALRAIEEPGDSEAVVFLLRGMFGTSHEHLAKHVGRGGTWRYTREDQPAGVVADALRVLRDVHRERRRRSLSALLDLLVERTRAAGVWRLSSRGVSMLANLDKVKELVRQLEATTTTSAEVVSALLGADRNAKQEDLPVADPDVDAVRITSLFKAKGREAPVVVMAHAKRKKDDARTIVDRDGGRVAIKFRDLKPPDFDVWVEREDAETKDERRRWMYVAATRACDQLVICRSNKSRLLDADLSKALAATADAEHDAIVEVGEGVQIRVRDLESIPEPPRSDETFPGHDDSIDALLAAPPTAGDAVEPAWRAERAAATKRAERSSLRWRTVSQEASRVRGRDPAGLGGGVGLLGGKVVHRVMEHLDLAEPAAVAMETVPSLVELYARIVGLPAEDAPKCVAIVASLLEHDVVERARAAPERWQEAEFTFKKRGRIISGTIDLCFPTDATRKRWVVADWKSDLPAVGSPARARYEHQVKLYAEALIANLVDHPIEVDAVLVGPHAGLDVDLRERALRTVHSALASGLAALLDAGAPVPAVGMDVGVKETVGELELCWEDAQVGLLLDRDTEERAAIAAEGFALVEASSEVSGWADAAIAALAARLGVALAATEEDEPA
ncbi:MAG: UvrD-helicase domain-containing protein [Deltaproteobacteria bacterium]